MQDGGVTVINGGDQALDDFHAQRTEVESGVCWSNTQWTTRSTWSGVRRKHVGRRLDVNEGTAESGGT